MGSIPLTARRNLSVLCAALLVLIFFATTSHSPFHRAQLHAVNNSTITDYQSVLGENLDANPREHDTAPAIDTNTTVEHTPTPKPQHPSPAVSLSREPLHESSELVSLSTSSGRYFLLFYEGNRTYNPNIIPHPAASEPPKWIAIARARWVQSRNDIELVCTATFRDGALVCDGPAAELSVYVPPRGKCDDETYWFMNLPGNQGPRDARVFWGPDEPYVLWNALASRSCLGLWLQNARYLLDPFRARLRHDKQAAAFATATELQRPGSYSEEEKNFFIFWDTEKRPYVHHDIFPNRVFAALNIDGSVGKNLAPRAAKLDKLCMDRYMPTLGSLGSVKDHVHQGTNTLSITLCNRGECTPDSSNTFIMHVFQRKIIYKAYSQYEPYTILFKGDAPFTIHAISQEPLWIRGRTQERNPATHDVSLEDLKHGQDDFLYVTSMSWKSVEQRYHGYLDDVVLLSFGVHDGQSGAADFEARHLLQSVAYC